MSGNRQMEVHYVNTGFPYTENESFMDFFEGLGHVPLHYADPGPIHDQIQENAYWSTNMNAYKYGFSGPGSTSYYAPYEVNDNLPSMDVGRATWGYPSVVDVEEPTTADTHSEEDASLLHTSPEERIPNHTSSDSSQVVWQDDIDLDNMTYEELLDLGETVGTQSRGLSPELINLLPTSKCKFKGFFSRKKAEERCVICQTRYKRGDRQTKLPCEHVYHSECITKWLGINKVCPICNSEVFGEETKH
ncbi:RING/U-box superfamily protein [Euphorbia peplus]|nr:RING/U-box superfamily protein [Euphorbia peplus]